MMKTLLLCLFAGIWLFQAFPSHAQCTTRVTHLSGTQLVDCTDVTVSAQGGTGSTTACPGYPVFPYWVGLGPTGSYTFVFNPPISGFTLDIYGLNNTGPGDLEELVMEIDGVPTPFTDAGVSTGCLQPPVLFGGAIRACVGCFGSGRDIHVNQPISTLTIQNTVLAGGPNGTVFSLFICCGSCATDAGMLTNGTFNICGADGVVTLSPASQTQLDPDDLLQYVLHTDQNNPLASALATSSTPTFTFNPATMTFDTPYYITAVAGNNLNGNVDPADPCFDVSNAATVSWRPWPTVQHTVTDPDLCEGDCTTIDLQFTGNAPFELQYSLPWGVFSVESLTNNSMITVCSPAGTPAGPVNLQFVSLSDNYCVCN